MSRPLVACRATFPGHCAAAPGVDYSVAVSESANPIADLPAAQPLLAARGLACQRGARVLFSALSFTLGPGWAAVVEGANGSGKTSLLRILCGLRPPEAGQVLWEGRDAARQRRHFHSQLAYVGHQEGVKADLTVQENLAAAVALAGQHPEGLAEALARVGLGDHLDVLGGALSAGQRRRVALARLLVGGPALWVLDEPFTALDTGGRELVTGLLEEHLAGGGLAVVASHHPLGLSENRVQPVAIQP